MKERTLWSSNTAFVLAAIGSAIGLGNLWRFPYICAKNGGGAFLVAYFVALLSVGIPILILEIGSGHHHGKGVPEVMKSIKERYEWIGWAIVLISFVITCYYSVVMSWSINYFLDSFSLSWGTDTKGYYFNKVLGITSGPMDIGGIQPMIFIGLIISWIAIIACIWKGPETVSKVVYATVILPWIILIIFIFRGVTLPGAMEGLKFYLTPDWAILLTPNVWLEAYTQIFFSLSIGFGIMFAYGSFLSKKTNINKYVVIIGLADALTAFFSGFAVFSAIGYLSHVQGVPISDLKLSGPGLVFTIYPTIINKLPVLPELFGVLFFLMLFALAIDSTFSMIEAVTSAVEDKFGWSKQKANLVIGGMACAIGTIFTTGSGLYWLDITDYFVTNFGIGLAVLVECIIIGWIFKASRIRSYINQNSSFNIGTWWDAFIKFLAPILLCWFVLNGIIDRIESSYQNYGRLPEFLGGWLVLILIITTGFFLSRKQKVKHPAMPHRYKNRQLPSSIIMEHNPAPEKRRI